MTKISKLIQVIPKKSGRKVKGIYVKKIVDLLDLESMDEAQDEPQET